ncbi:hypothetical protein D4N10_14955, partial [Klebsiella pneumoniae]
MAYLPEQPEWTDGVYQLEKSDPVRGGVDGPANRPLIDLLKRTAWLKQRYEEAFSGLGWAELGEWAVGLEVTTPSQIVHYQGYWYRYGGSLPHTITGASPSLDDNDNWFNLGNDVSLRANLGSGDGLKLIGRCATVALLRTTEPTQNIQLIRTISYSAGLAPEMPRGGGDYEYDPDDTTTADDGILTIVTSDGARWKKILNDLSLTCADAGVFPSGDDDTDALNALFTVVASFWWTRGRFRLDMMGLKFSSSRGNTVEFDPNRIELCNFYINNVYYTSTTPFAIVCARSTLPFQDGVNRVQGNVENLKIGDSTRHTTSPVTALYLVSDVNGASSSVVFNNLVAHGSQNGIAYGSHCYLTTFNGGSISAGNNNVDAVTAGLEASLVDMGENFRFNGMTFMGTRIFNWGTMGAEFNFTDVSMDFVALGVNNASGFVLDVKGGHAEFNNSYERWFSSSKPAYVSFKPAWVVCDGTNATTDHMFYDDTGAKQLSVDSDVTYWSGTAVKSMINTRLLSDKSNSLQG